MKNPINNPAVVTMLKKFNLKRVVEGRGHDCGGLLADVCLKNKVLIDYKDDGWGGEPELHFKPEAEEILKKEFEAINFAQIIFENGYEFMKSADKINFHLQVTIFVEVLQELRHTIKTLKNTKKWLMFGTPFRYSYISWPKVTNLKQLKTTTLQRVYDKYKAQLKDGQSFLNTDEQLISLGIKL